jgi:type II secretory pathway component PulF
MINYRYTAKNEQGELVSGTIDATGPDVAREHLERQGLQVLAVEPTSKSPGRLSSQEAEDFAQQVARVSSSQVPLAAGLRAAAAESGSRRTARALRWIAGQLDQGRTLEYVLTESKNMLPHYIAGLTLAAARTHSIGDALVELVDQQRTARQLRRGVAAAFSYPMVVVALTMAVVGFVFVFVTGPLKEMMEEFEMQLPILTQVLFWWRDTGVYVLVGCMSAITAALALYRLVAGKARYLRMLATVPLFGPLFHWSGVAEWLGLMSILTRHEIPLPEALRLAGGGVRDANVAEVSLQLAEGVSRGRNLPQLLVDSRRLPVSLAPLLRVGEKSGALSDSFAAARDIFQKRVRTRAVLVQSLVPPILFIAIGCVACFILYSQFAPLVSLISALS